MKLSEPGRLYLVDYYVLNEARNEMIGFLDDVVEHIGDLLRQDIRELNSDLMTWSVWTNQRSPGWVEASFKLKHSVGSLKDTGPFVLYRDSRWTPDLDSPLAALIAVRLNAVVVPRFRATPPELSSSLIAALQNPHPGKPIEANGRNLWLAEVPFDLEDSQAAAQLVAETMIDKCIKISDFMQKLAGIDLV